MMNPLKEKNSVPRRKYANTSELLEIPSTHYHNETKLSAQYLLNRKDFTKSVSSKYKKPTIITDHRLLVINMVVITKVQP